MRSPSITPEPSHRPTELRIGSRTSLPNYGSPMRSSVPDFMPNMHRRLSYCSTTSSESNDGQSFEGSISPMGILQGIGEVGTRKQTPILSSLKRTRPNHVLHHSLTKISTRGDIGSPVRKSLTPTHSHSHRRNTAPNKVLSKTASAGMLLDSNQQDEFTELNRLDQLTSITS